MTIERQVAKIRPLQYGLIKLMKQKAGDESRKALASLSTSQRQSEHVTVTKKELITLISQQRGIHPNDVRNIVQAFLDSMTDVLSQGNRLEFRDFGVFEVVERRAKIGRNPKKAAVAIMIPSRSVVKFTPAKKMRAVIDSEVPRNLQGEE